jgi:hypothetical protein
VEALPRVLWIQNGLINDTGLSPYHILFGRDRLEGGIPYEAPTECEDAKGYFERMSEMDNQIMQLYTHLHEEKERRYNATRAPKTPFKEGDLVWVLRSQPVTSQKLESWWLGPATVEKQVGKESYKVVHKPGEIWEVHRDFLKPYVADDLMGTGVPLYYFRGTTKSSVLRDSEDMVHKIEDYREEHGKIEFLVRWKDQPDEAFWVPSTAFFFSKLFP